MYLDTSVIGGCLDEEFAQWSKRLLEECRQGRLIAVISGLTRRELEEAPKAVQAQLAALPAQYVEHVPLIEEAEGLAQRYLTEGVVAAQQVVDAQHIAIATVEDVDVVVSWNFKHIVNLDRIHAFNAVNLKAGYHLLEIRSPAEVVHEEDV
jgi:hypothetical protein